MSKYPYKQSNKKLENEILCYLLNDYKTIPGYTRYDKIFLSKFNHSQDDIDKALSALISDELLELSLSDPLNVKIILQSKAFTYFRNKKKDSSRFWVPVVISIIALFRPEIIIISKFLLAFTKKLLQVLKQIQV